MKRKKRNRQPGGILPYLHVIGETFGQYIAGTRKAAAR